MRHYLSLVVLPLPARETKTPEDRDLGIDSLLLQREPAAVVLNVVADVSDEHRGSRRTFEGGCCPHTAEHLTVTIP